jgi:hypothetical protein
MMSRSVPSIVALRVVLSGSAGVFCGARFRSAAIARHGEADRYDRKETRRRDPGRRKGRAASKHGRRKGLPAEGLSGGRHRLCQLIPERATAYAYIMADWRTTPTGPASSSNRPRRPHRPTVARPAAWTTATSRMIWPRTWRDTRLSGWRSRRATTTVAFSSPPFTGAPENPRLLARPDATLPVRGAHGVC